jgi:hypothetical protein
MSYPLLRRSDTLNRLLNLGGDLRRHTIVIHIVTVIRIHIDKQVIIVLNRYVILLRGLECLECILQVHISNIELQSQNGTPYFIYTNLFFQIVTRIYLQFAQISNKRK